MKHLRRQLFFRFILSITATLLLHVCYAQQQVQQAVDPSNYKAHDIGEVTTANLYLYLLPDSSTRTKDYLAKGNVFEVIAVEDSTWVEIAFLDPRYGTIKRWMQVADNDPMSAQNIKAGYAQPRDSTVTINGRLDSGLLNLTVTNNRPGILNLNDARLCLMYISLASNQYLIRPLLRVEDDLTLLPGETRKIDSGQTRLNALTGWGGQGIDNKGKATSFNPSRFTGEWLGVPVLTRAGWDRPVYGQADTLSAKDR